MTDSIKNSNIAFSKSINYCDLQSFKQYFLEVDKVEQNLSLRRVIESGCSTEIKKAMLEELDQNGIKASGLNTMLALSILSKDKDLVLFAFSKVQDFTDEDISLVYALQEKDCGIALKLLGAGVNITDDIISVITDDNIKSACLDIQHLQYFNSSLSISTDNIMHGISSIESAILMGHNLCSEPIM